MKRYITLITILIAFGLCGCKKDYLSLETNPNQPSVTTPQLALSAAQVAAAAIVQTNYTEYGVWGGYWTSSGNYTPNPSLSQYQLTLTTFTGVWDNLYLNLSNFNTLQNLSAKDPNLGNFQAISLIMKAYDYEQLVDNFNNIIYSQAFNPAIINPAYDKGQDVYHDLGKQLDAAIALINKTASNGLAVNPGSADVTFGGNMMNWKRFANSIKLRLALHVFTKFPSDLLVSDLASTAAEGYLDGTTQAITNPGYANSNSGSGVSQQNPFYGDYGFGVNGNPTGDNQVYRANAFAVNFYISNNDPRASAFYAPTLAGNIIQGNVFGNTVNALQNPNTSAVGPGLLKSASQSAVLFSGYESLFLQAEALQDGLAIGSSPSTPQTAQAAYEAGITASFISLGLTAEQAISYYSQSNKNVGWTGSTDKLQAIIVQKWASLNGLFNLEAYNEYRRTGYPALPSSIDPAALSPTLPTRILYPLSELSTNSATLSKEGTISPFTSKIFWAK